jgi:hypothetical protein
MSKAAADDLGKIACSLRGSIAAGSWQTCVLKYTAGFSGIDDTGSIKIVCRYATDSGTPQFDDPFAPNFVSAVASNGAHLALRYDLKDNRRPWGKTIHIKVLQGYLKKGETITVTLGDTSGGSPGWRQQTFCEDTFELKILVDRYATYVYEELPKSPTYRIAPGEPTRLVAIAPSLVVPNKKIGVRVKREDVWGNPVGKPWKILSSGYPEPGVYRILIEDPETGLATGTNPILVSGEPQPQRFWADIHGQSEETIGTNSIDSYFRFARDRAFVDICGHQGNDFQITDEFWQQINETTARFNKSGKFVVFPGWEWSGNTGLGGDRNVFFKNEGGIILRSSKALVDPEANPGTDAPHVVDLFDTLERFQKTGDVMLVPHVGGRYADLASHSPTLEPVVEVHSAWGTFEWMLDDAFSRGYRVGIVANSDGHKGRPGASFPGASTFGSYGGLTCVLAEKLDRDSVWNAYQSRQVYATTGARIFLDVTTDVGHSMGEVISANDPVPTFHIRVAGTAPIERVEIRNGMRVMKTARNYTSHDLKGGRIKVVWQGATVRGRGRQVNWDGGLVVKRNRIASFQPINFWNPEKRCQQISDRELAWQSLTTGGTAGVILNLKQPGGTIDVTTTQASCSVRGDEPGTRGEPLQLGGVGKQIQAYQLQPEGGACELIDDFKPMKQMLHKGDNPIYICVVQEDGHMAWSSPIYLVR